MTPRQLAGRQRDVDAARAARGEVSEVQINGRRVKRGDIIKIAGETGEFRFDSAHVVDGVCESIQVFGGKGGVRGKWRHFTPDRFKAKVYKPKSRAFAPAVES